MANLLERMLRDKGRLPPVIESAGIFLQEGHKTLIPVVNGKCLFDLENDFTKALKMVGNRVCRTPSLFLESQQDDFTLGFIASKGFVCIRVKDYNVPWMAQRYFDLTGADLPDPEEKGNYFSVSTSLTGSGDYFHVGFPFLPVGMRDAISFGHYKVGGKKMQAPIRWDDWDTCAKYNSKNYVLMILGMGFRLGKNVENIAAIRQNVKNPEAFDQGCVFEVPETCEVEIA